MSAVPEEERFAKNSVIMGTALHEAITKLYQGGYKTVDPNLVGLAITVMSAFNKHSLIQGFIENSHQECWDYIKQRDEEYFVMNASNIFRYLPTDKVDLFRDLFTTKDPQGRHVISQSIKDQIWSLFDAMIKISIKYIHKGRAPYSSQSAEGITRAYGAQFYEDVDLNRHASTWNVQLDFPIRSI